MNTKLAGWVTALLYITATLMTADTLLKYPPIRAQLATFYLFALVMSMYVAKKLAMPPAALGGILLLAAVQTVRVALRI